MGKNKTSKERATRLYSSLAEWKEDFRTKRYYAEWTDFIRHSVLPFEEMELAEIYNAVKKGYPGICVDYVIYRTEPKWRHMVRGVLDGLMKEVKAVSVSRGKWAKLR